MYGDYQQIVHKFCCQGGVDHQPSAEVCFVAIGSLERELRECLNVGCPDPQL